MHLQKVLSGLERSARGEVHPDLALFVAERPPPISVGLYIHRLATHTHCTDEALLLFLALLLRIVSAQKYVGTSVAGPCTIHRLVLSVLVLAIKYQDEDFHVNSYYALCGGVSLPELNRHEIQAFSILEFSLWIDPVQFSEMRSQCLGEEDSQCETRASSPTLSASPEPASIPPTLTETEETEEVVEEGRCHKILVSLKARCLGWLL
jgi:hypothetical protein